MTYEEMQALLVPDYEGRRIRLVHANGFSRPGVFSSKDYGHCVDLRIDHHGGIFNDVERIEVMVGSRYQPITKT